MNHASLERAGNVALFLLKVPRAAELNNDRGSRSRGREVAVAIGLDESIQYTTIYGNGHFHIKRFVSCKKFMPHFVLLIVF